MSLASPNVRATYDSVHGPKKGISMAAVRRNRRLKKLEAYGTIPHDNRAPTVVQKADADLAQQEQEMGNGDDATSSGQLDAPSNQADRGGPSASGSDGDAPLDGPEGSPLGGRSQASPGDGSEPSPPSDAAPGSAAQADAHAGEDA